MFPVSSYSTHRQKIDRPRLSAIGRAWKIYVVRGREVLTVTKPRTQITLTPAEVEAKRCPVCGATIALRKNAGLLVSSPA